MTLLAEQVPGRPVPRRSLAGGTTGRLARARRLLAWHPEWWVYAVAALAAASLVLPVVSDAVRDAVRGGHDHATHQHGPGAGTFLSDWVGGWRHWAVMAVAMMLPLAAAQVHTVATRSLWSRRHRAAVAFVFAFMAVWFAAGGILVAVAAPLGATPSGASLALVLVVAAGWHAAPRRRRLLRRCSALRLGHPSGVAADGDCLRAGLRSALRCVGTCGPMMAAMVFSHSLMLMSALALVMLGERSRGPNALARAGRPREALALLGLAALAGAWAAVQ